MTQIEYKRITANSAEEIASLYASYNGAKEFLYIPQKTEIENTLNSEKACYIGSYADGKLVGIGKIARLGKPYPFFIAPKWDDNSNQYGISGMLVSSQYRGKGIAKGLVDNMLKFAKDNNANGVYADCDFRNVQNMTVLNSLLGGCVGFTDGSKGAKDEQTMYLTFYKSFSNKTSSETIDTLDLNIPANNSNVNLSSLSRSFLRAFAKTAPVSQNKVEYANGYNVINIIDTPINIKNINIFMEGEKIFSTQKDLSPLNKEQTKQKIENIKKLFTIKLHNDDKMPNFVYLSRKLAQKKSR